MLSCGTLRGKIPLTSSVKSALVGHVAGKGLLRQESQGTKAFPSVVAHPSAIKLVLSANGSMVARISLNQAVVVFYILFFSLHDSLFEVRYLFSL